MIKVSVLYPASENARFDLDYYCSEHMALVKDKLGAACKKIEVDAAISGAAPGSRPAYFAMGHMLFDSLEAYQAAFGPHVEAIMGDIPNYTDVEPIVVISEVKI
jgi:uncharacterized protein (TIGR02118 family)